MLSRIDGASSVEDISIMVGIKPDELLGILDRLAELGAVKLSWSTPKPPPGTSNADAAWKNAAAQQQQQAGKPPATARAFEEVARYQPRELDEAAQISVEIKKRILNAYYALEGKDFYEMLDVPRDADKKAIKSAYFELSKVFHPDSLFGKELGSFKGKMEAVFKRLTEAYEVLGRNNRRKEYDEYLAATEQTHQLQHTLDQVQREVDVIRTSMLPPTAAAPSRVASPVPSAPASPPPEARRAVLPPASPEARIAVGTSLRPPPTPDERRALARERLRRHMPPGSSPPPRMDPASSHPPPAAAAGQPPPAAAAVVPGSVRPPAANPTERRDSAIKDLRQSLRSTGRNTGGADPLLRYLQQAKDAEEGRDFLTAASALQSALALQPDRKELQEQYERVSRAVTRSLADNYEKQARYEEKMGKWDAAAASWERVSDGRPEDVHAATAAAEALLKASGDLHKAQRYAQRAVDLAPKSAAHVVTLAKVFLAAGLRLNARRELEKAVKLDPQDDMIKNLLREVR